MLEHIKMSYNWFKLLNFSHIVNYKHWRAIITEIPVSLNCYWQQFNHMDPLSIIDFGSHPLISSIFTCGWSTLMVSSFISWIKNPMPLSSYVIYYNVFYLHPIWQLDFLEAQKFSCQHLAQVHHYFAVGCFCWLFCKFLLQLGTEQRHQLYCIM